jgi:hypothetical protein
MRSITHASTNQNRSLMSALMNPSLVDVVDVEEAVQKLVNLI